MSAVVYVSIGNSDDKLTQLEWCMFVAETKAALDSFAYQMHGFWLSASDSRWQNACWCVALQSNDAVRAARSELRKLAAKYRQDSIAWAVAPETEFLRPVQ